MEGDRLAISSRDDLAGAGRTLEEASNDPNRSIELYLGLPEDLDDDYLTALTGVLETAKRVRVHEVYVNACFIAANNGKVDTLCDAIGNLNGLEEIGIAQYDDPINMCIQRVSRMLRPTKGLKKLFLFRVLFDGNPGDFAEFGAVLAGCTRLYDIDFPLCGIVDDKSTFENANPVLNAVTSLFHQAGFRIEWWIPKICDANQCSASLLLPLSKILDHRLTYTIGNPLRLAAVAAAYRYHHASFQTLNRLYLKIDKENLHHVAEIVECNNPYLTHLTLESDDGFFSPLIPALGKNTQLRNFDVEGPRWDERPRSDKCLSAFADMLETTNFSLWEFGDPEYETILETQQYIQEFGEDSESDDDIPDIFSLTRPMQRIHFYTKLNKEMRRDILLLKNPRRRTREDWIRRLHKSRNDVSCLFYFLSMNPFLCDSCGGRGWDFHNEAPIATRMRKRRKISYRS